MNDINAMHNLVQDVLDGHENPSRAMKVLRKHRENAIDKMEMLTRCMEEIEGADLEQSQRKVLKNRMSGYLHTSFEMVDGLLQILKTTKETEFQKTLNIIVYQIETRLENLKIELG